MDRSDEDGEGALETVAYLARSESRVAVLESVRDGPHTREELLETTDASRVTLDRVLGEFEDRGWAERTDEGYVPTREGEFVTGAFADLRAGLRPAPAAPDAGGVTGSDSAGHGRVGESPSGASVDDTLADIEFLARSSKRLTALEAIAETARTRTELKSEVSAARATLTRILGELEERGWIDRTNNHAEITPRGRTVADAFSRVLSNLAAAESLAPVFGWLPIEEFDFDLACLGDAALVLTDWDDPTKSIHHVASLVQNADRVRIVGPGATREVARTVRILTVERGGRFEGVIDRRGLETIREDEVLREHLRAILESGRATIACHDRALPLVVVVLVDDTVVLCGSEGEGPAHQAVESRNERVRSWAETYVEEAMAAAEPLDVDVFTP